MEKVLINEDVLDGLLTYSKMNHPREGILLLRGKSKKGVVEVQSLVIPPMAIHGDGFSSFYWNMLPVDTSYVGVAHSHPSGHAVPSHQDVLHASGRIMVIMGYPYSDARCLGVFNTDGEPVPFEIKKEAKVQGGGENPDLSEPSPPQPTESDGPAEKRRRWKLF